MLTNQVLIIHKAGQFLAALINEHIVAEVQVKGLLNFHLPRYSHRMAKWCACSGEAFTKPGRAPCTSGALVVSAPVNISVCKDAGQGTEGGSTLRTLGSLSTMSGALQNFEATAAPPP